MTCCEGWTSCNGFSLLVLLLLGVFLNAIPLIVNRLDEGKFLQNPISCFEWWFPGIIGAGLMRCGHMKAILKEILDAVFYLHPESFMMINYCCWSDPWTHVKTVLSHCVLNFSPSEGFSLLNGVSFLCINSGQKPGVASQNLPTTVIPATTASLAARKRACCNNRGGMFLSSFLNALTIIGAVYCILVSAQALVKGPLICHPPDNGTTSCEFSLDKLGIHAESFDLQWFTNGSCVLPNDLNSPLVNAWRNHTSPSGSKEGRYKTIHFSVFVGLLLVGALELLFGLSQILVGFLGCLCGVSKRRSQIV